MTHPHFPNSKSLAATSATPSAKGSLLLVGLGSNPSHAFGDVLIDSGADYVVLPEKAGLRAGVNLPAQPSTTLRGVGGSVRAELVANVSLEFEGLAIVAEVMFDYSNSVPALFGRSGIRALKEIGLDRTDWHWMP
ncbi:MAG TPA: aspartyl protease family protein [Casimicrobiaceae bacterium]|nr:aspartyl protease family protein [Casimicrobiaceae bacterium]